MPRDPGTVGVGVFQTSKGLKAAGRGHPRLDLAFLEKRGFGAIPGDAQPLPAGNGRALVAVGLGKQASLDAEGLRSAGAALMRSARSAKVTIGLSGIVPNSLGIQGASQAFAEGALLASYEFRTYKNGNGGPEARKPELLTLVGAPQGGLNEGIRRASVSARATASARDLINQPPSDMTPIDFSEIAVELARVGGLGIEVWEEDRIAEEKLGGVLGVSAGSAQPPRFLRVTYRKGASPVALIGKGVTFDSGGLSLKSASGMETMKTDMSGAAAVICTMSALEEFGVKIPVVGYIPLVENMPGGGATKPGDVLRARNGKTIEVLNTDAEGRLILADALCLAVEAKPAAVVDLATLTGACSVALGDRIAGLMGNNDRLLAAIEAAAFRSGEGLWRLPLPSQYRKHIESEVADIKNVGAPGGQAGALTAGLFLAEFAGDGPWAHLDIAGPARSNVDDDYLKRGGTGFGVRTLIEFLSSFTRAGLAPRR
ncbi:MAG TPA: leucyl aminopeptidase [Acidimicrobiales bacterium]|nr:leucyl aminopeptidase [Acidimicrobiales bacterium]